MRKTLVAFLGVLACHGASADVVYSWQTLDGTATPITGEIRLVGDSTPASASLDYIPFNGPDPTSNIISLWFTTPNHVGLTQNYHTGTGFPDQQRVQMGLSGIDQGLFGWITSGGSAAYISMWSGLDGLWTIHDLGSDDADNPHCWGDLCPGVTGRWVLDSPAIVPEPNSLLLAALSLVGLFGITSRLQASSAEPQRTT